MHGFAWPWHRDHHEPHDKLLETYLVRLESVSSARVQQLLEYRKSEFVEKLEISPQTYVVVLKSDSPLARHRELYHKKKLKPETKLPNDREAKIVFPDEQSANKVADGIRLDCEPCLVHQGSVKA